VCEDKVESSKHDSDNRAATISIDHHHGASLLFEFSATADSRYNTDIQNNQVLRDHIPNQNTQHNHKFYFPDFTLIHGSLISDVLYLFVLWLFRNAFIWRRSN